MPGLGMSEEVFREMVLKKIQSTSWDDPKKGPQVLADIVAMIIPYLQQNALVTSLVEGSTAKGVIK